MMVLDLVQPSDNSGPTPCSQQAAEICEAKAAQLWAQGNTDQSKQSCVSSQAHLPWALAMTLPSVYPQEEKANTGPVSWPSW